MQIKIKRIYYRDWSCFQTAEQEALTLVNEFIKSCGKENIINMYLMSFASGPYFEIIYWSNE